MSARELASPPSSRRLWCQACRSKEASDRHSRFAQAGSRCCAASLGRTSENCEAFHRTPPQNFSHMHVPLRREKPFLFIKLVSQHLLALNWLRIRPFSKTNCIARTWSSSVVTGRCAARCSSTYSPSSSLICGNRPCCGPLKPLREALLSTIFCFCFRRSRTHVSGTPNDRDAARFPSVSAHAMTFLLKAASWCTRVFGVGPSTPSMLMHY